jgi:hypothetical protein
MKNNDYNSSEIKSEKDIPEKKYVVYSLEVDNCYIVMGHGKKNRAKVIFDNINTITYSHIKSFKVRLYHLFKSENEHEYKRKIIVCKDKEEAQEIEKILHLKHNGGNTNELVKEFGNDLIKQADGRCEQVELLLKIALNSSNSGLNDLRKWYKKEIVDDEKVWDRIKKILKLQDLKGWK